MPDKVTKAEVFAPLAHLVRVAVEALHPAHRFAQDNDRKGLWLGNWGRDVGVLFPRKRGHMLQVRKVPLQQRAGEIGAGAALPKYCEFLNLWPRRMQPQAIGQEAVGGGIVFRGHRAVRFLDKGKPGAGLLDLRFHLGFVLLGGGQGGVFDLDPVLFDQLTQ